jgi:hypothetical protein
MLGLSGRNIASNVSRSCNTATDLLAKAAKLGL